MDRSPTPRPAALAPLCGREHDLIQLVALLHGGVTLLTLRWPGGIGKTALAQHLARRLTDDYDHVQFIDLSAVRAADQVANLIVAALPAADHALEPGRLMREFTAGRRTVLVLDNFEQVLPAAALLGEWLASTEHLQLVVTSRVALNLHDEHDYLVRPLSLPLGTRDVLGSAAVQLFVARVQAVLPTFTLNARTTPQVMRLCELLEGVPLALELAAVRTRSYSLGDLLVQLEHPLDLLKANFQDRPERLRSLRAAVEWSYNLLDEQERAVFECCAVFKGSFTPQALTAVWGSPEVLGQAESLLEQSFLHRLEASETLWKMLEPLRELAHEHLAHNPLTPT
ncbi:hypothetical protein [Deinococcus sp. QL22]|uniref:ATP-binding protein n=1 Tax=Deinococcus sp. QL22 TaxID=2939437 RepID=UPI002018264A|nr:hypothetical protein [Deinococcus sp. QL22]UQN09362.1 hypothetical protein M1R55_22640 [Deinococcus sp. QL22]